MALAVLSSSLALGLGAASSGCENGTVSTGRSRIRASTASIDFGRVYLGVESRQSFFLTAPGELAVHYAGRFEGVAGGFVFSPGTGTLGRNGSVEIVAGFNATVPGRAEATIVFESDATENSTVGVSLFATAVAPPDCEDGNGCTLDTFDTTTGRCEHAAQTVACDDFDACTQNDTCVNAVCLGESVGCDDNDPCTDDFCDSATGCVHELTGTCDDHNPCTADSCDRTAGCMHSDLPDGTECDDSEVCTEADVCVFGECTGIAVPEGTPCDDGDPCSKHDQCVMGTCRDPTYFQVRVGEIKFATKVGVLGAGASGNPILDRDGTTFVGTSTGVAAVDQCGAVLWTADTNGTPIWAAATSIPGTLVVPVGDRTMDLETDTGLIRSALVLDDVFGPLPSIATSSTATASVRIVDLAVRASGALVASLVRHTTDQTRVADEGLLAEIDRTHRSATPFRHLGTSFAARIAIDRDESVVALLHERSSGVQRLVRYGVNGLAGGSWSTTASSAASSEIALGPEGQVIWSQGLVAIGTTGSFTPLLEDPLRSSAFDSGSPVVRADRSVVWSLPVEPSPLTERAFATGAPYQLVAVSLPRTATAAPELLWRRPLLASATASSPVIDAESNVFIVTREGVLLGFDRIGTPILELQLPVALTEGERVSLAITPTKVVIVAVKDQVIGVRWSAGLAGSSWPKHRRDNLSTGHR